MLSLAVLTSICLFSNIVYCRPYTSYFSLPCPFTQPCTDPFNYRASNQVCPPTCNPCVPNSCIPSNIYNPCIPGNPYNPCIPSNLYNPCIPGNSGNPCNPYIPSNPNPCNPGNPCIPYNPYNPYNPCNPSNFCKPCPSPSEDDKKKKDDDNKEDDKKFSCTRMAQPPMDMNNYMPEAPNAPNAPKDMTRSRKPPGLLTSLFSIPGAIADSVLSGEISL